MKGWKYESHRHSLAARGIRTSFAEFKVDLPDAWTDAETSSMREKIWDLVKKNEERIATNRKLKIWPEVKVGEFVMKDIREFRPGLFNGFVKRIGKEDSWEYSRQYAPLHKQTYDEFVKSFKFAVEESDFSEKFAESEKDWGKK